MRNATILLASVLAVCLACPAGAQNPGEVTRGRAFAEKVCSSCHAVGPGQTFSPQPGLASFKIIANTPGMTGTALAVWLKTPHKTMPNFILEPQEIADVISYIVTLRD